MKLTNKISVFISRDNIKRGRKHNPCLCPIALAISEKYGLAANKIMVSPEITLFNNGRESVFQISPEGYDFLLTFDKGGYVDPCTIEAKLVRQFYVE